RHRPPTSPRRPQVPVRLARLLRRLVPRARAEPRDDEARPGGGDGGAVVALREEVPIRDGRAGREAGFGSAGSALALDELLGRLLLRGRIPLPPLDPPAAPPRPRSSRLVRRALLAGLLLLAGCRAAGPKSLDSIDPLRA